MATLKYINKIYPRKKIKDALGALGALGGQRTRADQRSEDRNDEASFTFRTLPRFNKRLSIF